VPFHGHAKHKMANQRDWYKYHFKIRNRIVKGGITQDLDRREQELQREWPRGHIRQIGRRTTEEAARDWEKQEGFE
jgi:hypothetical protein